MYISKTAQSRLEKHRVEIVLNARVADIEHDAIQLANGETVASDMTIVSRGIKVNDESFHPHLSFNDQYQANDADHIYLCGDIAKHGLIATAHNAMFE
jgi:NADH dehydrogenase FAD-containing subunit